MMKYIKSIFTYIVILMCIAAFGLFIYPGMYKYDKLNQKYPVQINRITGETKVLTADGWKDVSNFDSAADQMELYKQEIEKMIADQNEVIKSSVIEEVRSEIENAKNEFISASAASVAQGGNGEAFTLGDSTDRVKEVMGTPSRVREVGPLSTWYYGNSTVKFKDGKVNGWEDLDGNLFIE